MSVASAGSRTRSAFGREPGLWRYRRDPFVVNGPGVMGFDHGTKRLSRHGWWYAAKMAAPSRHTFGDRSREKTTCA